MSRHIPYTDIKAESATEITGHPIMKPATPPSAAHLFVNCQAVTLSGAADYGLIADAAIAVRGGHIHWIGPTAELPAEFDALACHDLGGRLLTPALIDCHTHVVHGGNRAGEFELRLKGASYEEVARAGGGIVSTVRATRAASVDDLVAATLPRIDAMIAEGVSTIEIKSGYGLDTDTELRMLRAARAIAGLRAVTVRTSFLGAHAVPADHAGDADAYIDDICIPTLRAAHAEALVDAVDGFCEGIAFSPAQIARVFDARSAGIKNMHTGAIVDAGEALRPPQTRYHSVAGSLGGPGHPIGWALGDGMVRVRSAHAGEDGVRIPGLHHMDLLNHPAVFAEIVTALGD